VTEPSSRPSESSPTSQGPADPADPSFRRTLRRGLFVLTLLAYALVFQGSRPLWEPDEGRYSAVALRMIDFGDPIVPRLNAEIEHFTKPPVTYWALAASVELFGRNEWALRLPNALAFVATALLAGAIAKRLGFRDPRIATIVYATSILPAVAANVVTTDTLLALFETLALLAFVSGWREPDPRRAATRFDLMWLAFGAAFLTKGPPGLLPLLPIAVFVRTLPADARPRLWRARGIALGAALGFSWFAAVVMRRPDLVGYFLTSEVYDRIATNAHDRNGEWYGAFIVYGPAMLLGFLPWLPLLLRAPSTWARRLRETVAARASDPTTFFLTVAVLLPLLVFCVARSRLALYVLPLFVPLALLVGRSLDRRDPATLVRRARVPLALWIVAVVGTRAVAASFPSAKDDRDLAAVITAAAPGTREVVFVGASPHWGVVAYVPAEIVRREIPDGDERPLPPGSAYLTLGDVERRDAAFLVPARKAKEWEAYAVAAGRRFEHAATIDDLLLYRPPIPRLARR